MKKVSLLINSAKEFDVNGFKKQLSQMDASDQVEAIIVCYGSEKLNSQKDFPVFTIDPYDDVSLTELLRTIPNDSFLFFNPELNYPNTFFRQLLEEEQQDEARKKESVWIESLIAVQQSSYGLCGVHQKQKANFDFLSESVLYSKKEVEGLNTDKMIVYPELAEELYRYASKKKLKFRHFKPKKVKIEYIKHFGELMAACQKKAQQEFKLFPALFVLFFLIFGFGGIFDPAFLLLFLIGMSMYLLAITLEAFGLSSMKKNGALLPILLFLFPFIHVVYGLESWFAKFKSKS